MLMTHAQSSQTIPEFDGEADMFGNELGIGAEVLFGIGSRLCSGTIIKPTPCTIRTRVKVNQNDDDDIDDDDDDDAYDADEPQNVELTASFEMVTVPGVLIYNDKATNRKLVTRPCVDVCIIAN